MDHLEAGRPAWEATFSARIAAARAAAGLTPEELARRMREYGVPVHAHSVELLESGTQTIGMNEALVLSKVLDIELPEVTVPIRPQLLTQSFSRKLVKPVRRWKGVKDRLVVCRSDTLELLDQVTSEKDMYLDAIAAVGGEGDASVLAFAEALRTEMSGIAEDLDRADRRLNGQLSEPPGAALAPGSQAL